jgi:hypothetical protein
MLLINLLIFKILTQIMNRFIETKNDSIIKKNSADFNALTIYSKHILNKDKIRIEEYKSFINNNKTNTNNYSKLKNIIAFTAVSGLLIYKFQSILIVPLFFCNYYIINRLLLEYRFKKECYFCSKNLYTQETNEKYKNYYKLIDYICNKAPVKNLNDFEMELDKIIKENNL